MTRPERSACAVLTPPGRGGIAVVRCVGPECEHAFRECFRPASRPASLPPAGGLAYGHVLDDDGLPLDEVILCRTPDGAFEVNCHGGPAAVAAVCRRLAALGLAQADADRLLEIEGAGPIEHQARRALRRAGTTLAARVLLDQLAGALAAAARRVDADLASGRTGPAAAGLDALLAAWQACGRFLAAPPRIVIAGRPNVGKSTLLNRLAGADRAITSAAPGTTRDYVEADAAIEGLPVVLVDTAGLGEARDPLERAGVERARREADRAAVVVYLRDATEGAHPEDEAMLRALGDRALAAWNKIDAPGAHPFGGDPKGSAPSTALGISALMGAGVEALGRAVLERLGHRAAAPGEAVPFTGAQAEALARAKQPVEQGRLDAARQALAPLVAG
jgi:tRNA modification GTPase